MAFERADHYAVLGVERDASPEEIKRAYRRLALECHPDRRPGDEGAAERFRLVNQAYDVLGDPERRARYEREQLMPGGLEVANLDLRSARDLLGGMFGDVLGVRRRRRRRGRDLRYTLTISLPDAALGSSHVIEFEAEAPCEACGGRGHPAGGRPPEACDRCEGKGEIRRGLLSMPTRCGRCDGAGVVQVEPCRPCRGRGTRRKPRRFDVRVPAGTMSGAERVLEGEGEPGRFGGGYGDLRVTVNVEPHAFLRREDDDIHSDLFVSLTEAVLGARLQVPCLEGVVWVEVPAGIQSGTKLRLRRKGVPRGTARGDHIVTVRVETPSPGAGTQAVTELLAELERRVVAEPSLLPQRAKQRDALGSLTDGPSFEDVRAEPPVSPGKDDPAGAKGRPRE